MLHTTSFLLHIGKPFAKALQHLLLRGDSLVTFANQQLEMIILHLQVRATLLAGLQLISQLTNFVFVVGYFAFQMQNAVGQLFNLLAVLHDDAQLL